MPATTAPPVATYLPEPSWFARPGVVGIHGVGRRQGNPQRRSNPGHGGDQHPWHRRYPGVGGCPVRPFDPDLRQLGDYRCRSARGPLYRPGPALEGGREHPAALTAAGGNVTRMRILAQVWCFALCGLAGVQLSMGQLTLFTEGMTSGLGFVALAAVIFCRGKVLLLALMSVGFGLSSAVAVQVNASVMPPQFAQMIPYVVAFVGLIILARTAKDGGIRIATPVLED